jgi:hypothetical protein
MDDRFSIPCYQVHTNSGVHPTFYPVGTGWALHCGRTDGAWRWPTHLRLVPNLWMCAAIPPLPHVFMVWCWIKHRDIALPLQTINTYITSNTSTRAQNWTLDRYLTSNRKYSLRQKHLWIHYFRLVSDENYFCSVFEDVQVQQCEPRVIINSSAFQTVIWTFSIYVITSLYALNSSTYLWH